MNYIDKATFFEIFVCDICFDKAQQINGEYKKDTISRLRKLGWKIGRYHTCPECSQCVISPWLSAKTKVKKPNIEVIIASKRIQSTTPNADGQNDPYLDTLTR